MQGKPCCRKGSCHLRDWDLRDWDSDEQEIIKISAGNGVGKILVGRSVDPKTLQHGSVTTRAQQLACSPRHKTLQLTGIHYALHRGQCILLVHGGVLCSCYVPCKA